MEGPKMRKSRRETANNFYVPPPARKLEDSESKATQCKKSEGTDSSVGTEQNKTKDRFQEIKPKKVAEETKICNNSSLLFKSENESAQPTLNSNDSGAKKKKKKKKKKKLSSNEQKTESDVCNLGGDNSLKTYINQNTLSNESDEEVGEGFWEIDPALLCQISPPVIHSLPSDYPSYSQSVGSSKKNASLSKKEPPAYTDQDRDMLHNLNQLSIHDRLGEKGNGLYCSEIQKQNIAALQEQNIGQSANGAIPKVGPRKLKKKKSYSSSSTETDIPFNLSFNKSNDLSLNTEDESEWERLLDDGFPEFDFYKSGNAGATENNKSHKSSYNFNSEKETSDCSIIEIYGFPEEFKTQDLLAPFSSFINRGFKLKWVDNTHALGIFPTPLLAEEALNSPLPFVRTRPLSQASLASKEKAQQVILPAALRPKTCTALARRLVSGALGVRAVFTKEEREAEREMLKEAREQKRMAAKQRDAAWEGKF